MRHDPVFLCFTVTGPDALEFPRLMDKLHRQTAPDAEVIDSRITAVGAQKAGYHISDFFDDVAIVPADRGKTVRVVFQRKLTAEPFWKDAMIRIIHSVESEPGVSVSLDYQGDKRLDWSRPLTAT